MLLRQLEYVTALARERHFGRAALACHVSQPALSAGIRGLERELKVTLVVRGQRFQGFTHEGERVVLWARRILAERDGLIDDLSSMRVGLSGVLRVAAIPTALTATSLLTSPLCAEHPAVHVSLKSASSREIVHRVAEFDLDVGVTYLDRESVGGLRAVPLYREHYLLLTPADGLFADRTSVGWAEVAKTPLCLLSPEMQHRRILDSLFAEAGAVASPAVETDAVSVLYAHVGTHRWSSVIAHSWLWPYGVPEGLRVVPLEPSGRAPRVGLVVAERDPEPILTQALLDVVGEVDLEGWLADLLGRHLAGRPSVDRPWLSPDSQ